MNVTLESQAGLTATPDVFGVLCVTLIFTNQKGPLQPPIGILGHRAATTTRPEPTRIARNVAVATPSGLTAACDSLKIVVSCVAGGPPAFSTWTVMTVPRGTETVLPPSPVVSARVGAAAAVHIIERATAKTPAAATKARPATAIRTRRVRAAGKRHHLGITSTPQGSSRHDLETGVPTLSLRASSPGGSRVTPLAAAAGTVKTVIQERE